jgi:muramoyltetrapeptide carboxypeptidase
MIARMPSIPSRDGALRSGSAATIGKKDFTFGGTDEERTKDLQQMLNDPSVKAIMCARGGYGLVRIIDKLDFTLFCKAAKMDHRL